jgi:hypothetical protein
MVTGIHYSWMMKALKNCIRIKFIAPLVYRPTVRISNKAFLLNIRILQNRAIFGLFPSAYNITTQAFLLMSPSVTNRPPINIF